MTDRPELRGQSLFLDANPERNLVAGWMGHLCKRGSKEDANCAAIPIQGAAPLCMVVATRDISEGDTLIRDVASNEAEALIRERITESGDIAMAKYATQITELKSFTNMAYPSAKAEVTEEASQTTNDSSNGGAAASSYKKINVDYPGITVFNKDPDIYAVENFLSDDECDRVIKKCEPHMFPSVTVNPTTGAVEEDIRRTSKNANLPQAEAPSIIAKLVKLLDCREEQLEILQVLRYEKGQEFKPHTDGHEGPTTACGFKESGRLVTIFTYLNDVSRGGHTYFPELGFSIAPKKGSAIVHFPSTESLKEDLRTLHQGMPAEDTKWLLSTWVWQHDRSVEAYGEDKLRKLSDDVI